MDRRASASKTCRLRRTSERDRHLSNEVLHNFMILFENNPDENSVPILVRIIPRGANVSRGQGVCESRLFLRARRGFDQVLSQWTPITLLHIKIHYKPEKRCRHFFDSRLDYYQSTSVINRNFLLSLSHWASQRVIHKTRSISASRPGSRFPGRVCTYNNRKKKNAR